MNSSATPIADSSVVPFCRDEVNGSIIQRFRKVVSMLGDSLALKSGSQALTFANLEDRSNALAHILDKLLTGNRNPVALMFAHGNDGIVAQLAVLKLGKFFSCIDFDMRIERRALVLAQLGADVLLCDSASHKAAMELCAAGPAINILNTDDMQLDFAQPYCQTVPIRSDDLAYIVNTSGTTGIPKGVMLSHRNVLFTAYVHGRDFELSCADRSLHICPPSTAAAGSEIFTALLNGSAVFPFSIKNYGIRGLQELLVDEQITTFTASPILFRMVFRAVRYSECFPSVRLIRLGGDRVSRLDVNILNERFSHDCRLRVGYGLSEYMPAMQLFIDRDSDIADVVPLGYPMFGCVISLIDENGAPAPAGGPGEIVISSRELSLGYWRDPERTDNSFGSDPTSSTMKTFRTNDMAYKDSGGCFHFIGRKDSIVKINGKQVCIADVQKAVLSISCVSDAAIVPVSSKQNGTELVAFIVSPSHVMEISHIRASLAKALPYEAMPSRLMRLDQIPLTANNKTDMQELQRLAAGIRDAS